MTFSILKLDRLDDACARALASLAEGRWMATAVLLALACICYLPGVMNLPPVDRSEIFYAENSQEMLEHNELLDPHFLGERKPNRPIGTYWLQVASAWVAGIGERDDITTYRIPSFLGVVIALLSTLWLLTPIIGRMRALVAAALVTVAPIVAVEANLAVTEGAALGFAVAAQLALLRVYVAPRDASTRWLALLFWVAQGLSIDLNALAIPILSLATVIALAFFDRSFAWMRRLYPLAGVPLMIVLGAPWLIVRAELDGGVPFSTMTWHDFIRALGGSQQMKWKAAPLTFTLALAVGFLPGALLWLPAIRKLWQERADALPRFLFAWLAGYLAYLELIASKPALYTVQVMFPAAAAAVALAMFGSAQATRPSLPPGTLRLPPLLGAIALPALFAGLVWAAQGRATLVIVAGALVVTALLVLAAVAARRDLASLWLASAVAGFAALLAFTFGVLLPHLDEVWPAERIAQATRPLAACAPGPIGVLGFREPSAIFVLGDDTKIATPDDIAAWAAAGERRVVVVENRWNGPLQGALKARSVSLPTRLGCIEAFNVMRGCPLSFSIYATGKQPLESGCSLPPAFACRSPLPAADAGNRARSRCD